jgi:hypothetical protein
VEASGKFSLGRRNVGRVTRFSITATARRRSTFGAPVAVRVVATVVQCGLLGWSSAAATGFVHRRSTLRSGQYLQSSRFGHHGFGRRCGKQLCAVA